MDLRFLSVVADPSQHRMLASRSLLLTLSFLTVHASALGARSPTSNLTIQLSAFVPLCAENCFISFLRVNYGLRGGDQIPSLEELCSTSGDSGFTLGEGAVQCIAGERSIDGCSEQDASGKQSSLSLDLGAKLTRVISESIGDIQCAPNVRQSAWCR